MQFPWPVAVTLAAGSVMLVLACVAQTQRRLLVANPFSIGCLLAAAWCFLYIWLLRATGFDEKLLVLKLGFSVIPFLPALALEITYRFVHERRLLHGWKLLAVLVVPIITAALAWTINSSPIFRYDCWLDISGDIPLLRFNRGPWNAIFYLYCCTLAIWSFAILLRSLHSAPPWVKRARILFLVARLIPLVVEILSNFDLFHPAGINYAPASIALSDILIGIIIFGDRLGYRAYVARSMLVEKIGDLLVVLDRGGRMLDMNHAAAETLGVRPEAIRGRGVEELFAAWGGVLPHLGDGPETVSEVEHDGRCFELSVIPVEREAGVVLLWLRDITRRKMAERDYRLAAADAREANSAKDRYLAVMSHEIRNPLNSVLGFMRLLADTRLDAEQREYIDHALDDGDNLLSLINEILDFSKIEAGGMRLTLAPFDLREEVNNFCRGMGLQSGARALAFTCHVAPDVPALLIGDRSRILQILRNLIGNAIKFTGEGSVDVRVDCPEKPGETPGCLVRIAVADTGIGIAPEELETLFQPFAQATPAIGGRYGGSGLGLVIAKRFSELMGGTITVESTPGRGSTFTCLLRMEVAGSTGTVPAACGC